MGQQGAGPGGPAAGVWPAPPGWGSAAWPTTGQAPAAAGNAGTAGGNAGGITGGITTVYRLPPAAPPRPDSAAENRLATYDEPAAAGTGLPPPPPDLAQRVAELERRLAESTRPPAAPAPPFGSEAIPSVSNFAGWNEGFFIQSADKSFQLRITGQIQADFRGFLTPVDTSTTDNGAVAGSPITGSPDTFLIRRARLGIEATMMDHYEFRLLPDFAGITVSRSITDAYLNVHYWDEFQFESGKFKQPFSYEQLIQDRYVPTLERSMMDQLVPQRDEGVMIHGHKLFGDRFDYAVAVSNGDPNDSTIDLNDHKDFNGRIDFRPFNDPEGWDIARGLQVGISGGVGVENEALGTTTSPPIITTPATVTWFAYHSGVLANGVRDRISPELVYFYHSLGVASQYYQQNQMLQLSATKPIVDVSIGGYYVLVTYLLTGEQRTDYTQQIDPIRPFNPCAPMASPGAWELAFRVERLEVGQQAFSAGLATKTAGTSNRSSPEAAETTLGLNWYLNKWVRAQLNWEHATLASPVKIGNVANPFTKEDALYTRFQIIF
jgi:phosphate-selective porin OprO/OprP